MAHHIFLLGFFSLTCSLVLASNPSPLQDFCVAKPNSQVLVNGLACEDPKLAQAQDFFFMGLHKPGNTSNPFGTAVAPVFVDQLPGLNTLGISMGRVDYAPWGVIPPHIHPRASEIITVLDGAIDMGFITSNPENRLISKTLQKGDVFVFPQGLVHFQRNVGPGNAVTLSALSSPSPGVITVANAVFGSSGPITADVLTKAFQVDKKTVDYLQAQFYLN
ncbi:putative germin-like protein 2-1 [Magnolia sinica]|uniref:putative germin-like protein 2-1 n=1 Tax=Magnolia sinica TaxID=86752 RepID=UPI00265B11B1|nr:putative germin-like protein 2-1 [Magnolia sinica]